MGNVSQVVPSIHPMVGIECGDAVNHQKEFAAATITQPGDEATRDGALGMAYTIVDMADQDVWDSLYGRESRRPISGRAECHRISCGCLTSRQLWPLHH